MSDKHGDSRPLPAGDDASSPDDGEARAPVVVTAPGDRAKPPPPPPTRLKRSTTAKGTPQRPTPPGRATRVPALPGRARRGPDQGTKTLATRPRGAPVGEVPPRPSGPRARAGTRGDPNTRFRTTGVRWAHPLGEVLDARDHATGDRVTLTRLRPGSHIKEEQIDAGRAAARALDGIGAPFVNHIVEIFRGADGRLAIVTEFVEATPLSEQINRRALSPARTITILRQLCKALSSGHQVGIAHGALCAASVWLTSREGRPDAVVVSDFGLHAVVEGKLDVLQADAASVPSSPERILGLPRGPAEDMYLFGCLGYQLLTGGPPFRTGSVEAVQRRHAIEDPMRIEDRLRSRRLPPQKLIDLVHRCLAKDSEERFSDLADLEAELCLAQIDGEVSTLWDDLPLPGVSDNRRATIARTLVRKPEPAAFSSSAADEIDAAPSSPIDISDLMRGRPAGVPRQVTPHRTRPFEPHRPQNLGPFAAVTPGSRTQTPAQPPPKPGPVGAGRSTPPAPRFARTALPGSDLESRPIAINPAGEPPTMGEAFPIHAATVDESAPIDVQTLAAVARAHAAEAPAGPDSPDPEPLPTTLQPEVLGEALKVRADHDPGGLSTESDIIMLGELPGAAAVPNTPVQDETPRAPMPRREELETDVRAASNRKVAREVPRLGEQADGDPSPPQPPVGTPGDPTTRPSARPPSVIIDPAFAAVALQTPTPPPLEPPEGVTTSPAPSAADDSRAAAPPAAEHSAATGPIAPNPELAPHTIAPTPLPRGGDGTTTGRQRGTPWALVLAAVAAAITVAYLGVARPWQTDEPALAIADATPELARARAIPAAEPPAPDPTPEIAAEPQPPPGPPAPAPEPQAAADAGEPPAAAPPAAEPPPAEVQEPEATDSSKPRAPGSTAPSGSADELAAKGNDAFNHGELADAARYFAAAVRRAPSSAAYRISLGDVYYKQHKYRSAAREYTKAQDLGHPSAAKRLEKANAELR